MLELDTAPMYNAAAQESGTTPADLRARTQIAAVPDSQLISITVTADTAEQAVAQADAIANTAIEANQSRIDAELDQVTAATRDLITGNTLTDSNAEQARVTRLGDTLGQNQSNLVVGSRNLVLLHSAEAASLLPSPALLGALGLVAGGLLGGVMALLLGARRGTIQTVKEMHQLYPNASVVDRLDLETVITLESENASVVYIAGLSVRTRTSSSPSPTWCGPSSWPNGRAVDGYDQHHNVKVAERSGSLQVITTTLSDTVLRRVERDSSSLLIVPVRAKVTRMEQLDTFASRLNDRTYLLVQSRDAGLGLTYAQDHQRSGSLDRGSVRRQLPGAAAVDPQPLHPGHHAVDVRLDGARPLGPSGRGQRSSPAALAAGDVGQWVVGDLAGALRQPAVRQRQQLGVLGGHLAAAGPAAATIETPGPTVGALRGIGHVGLGIGALSLLFTLTQLVGIGYRDWVGQIVPAPSPGERLRDQLPDRLRFRAVQVERLDRAGAVVPVVHARRVCRRRDHRPAALGEGDGDLRRPAVHDGGLRSGDRGRLRGPHGGLRPGAADCGRTRCRASCSAPCSPPRCSASRSPTG